MAKVKKRLPTERQLRTAKGISKHNNVRLEKWICKDAEACQKYIDFYQRTLPATEEQIIKASIFQTKTGLAPPSEISDNKYFMFNWNQSMASVAFVVENPVLIFGQDYDERTPTAAMQKYASDLAREHGLELPGRVIQERICCNAFIDHYKNHLPPNEKLIESALRYSVVVGIKTPSLILKLKDSTIGWVGILKRLNDFRQGAGSVLPTLE